MGYQSSIIGDSDFSLLIIYSLKLIIYSIVCVGSFYILFLWNTWFLISYWTFLLRLVSIYWDSLLIRREAKWLTPLYIPCTLSKNRQHPNLRTSLHFHLAIVLYINERDQACCRLVDYILYISWSIYFAWLYCRDCYIFINILPGKINFVFIFVLLPFGSF